VDFGMVFAKGQVLWRFPVAFQIMWYVYPEIIFQAGLVFRQTLLTLRFCRSLLSTGFIWALADTPRWYYAKGKIEEGDAVLARLHDLPITHLAVDATKSEILASLELERLDTQVLRLKDFFWDTSDNQAARRIRTGMCLFTLAYLQGFDFLHMTLVALADKQHPELISCSNT
jgi:hypothetical protein